jgi:hypothetical protein
LNVPIITSNEVAFTACIFDADPTSVDSVVDKMYVAWGGRLFRLQKINRHLLKRNSNKAAAVWKRLFEADWVSSIGMLR